MRRLPAVIHAAALVVDRQFATEERLGITEGSPRKSCSSLWASSLSLMNG